MPRRVSIVTILLGVFFVALWVLPFEVGAALKSVTPADTAIVAQQPPPVVLVFSTALVPSVSVGKVIDTRGTVVSTGSAIGSSDRTRLTIALRANLPNGTYTVTYHAVAANNGSIMNGATSFAIDIPENIAATSTAAINTAVGAYNAGSQRSSTPADAIVAMIAPTPASAPATQTVAAQTAIAAVSTLTHGTPSGVAAAPTRIGADATQTVAAHTAEAGLGLAVGQSASGTPVAASPSSRTMLPNTGSPANGWPFASIFESLLTAFALISLGIAVRFRRHCFKA